MNIKRRQTNGKEVVKVLREAQLKEYLKEMIFMLESIQDSEFLKSDDPVKNLRAMSVMISRIEAKRTLNKMIFLAKGLDYISFENRIINPIRRYFKNFGGESNVWCKKTYPNPEEANKIFLKGKSDLNSIIHNMKVNAYMY